MEDKELLEAYRKKIAQQEIMIKCYKEAFEHIHPVKVYRTKSRGNTTVIFLDGSSETVKLKKGEKDCLDTAIAYALMKHVYPKNVVKKLIVENIKL